MLLRMSKTSPGRIRDRALTSICDSFNFIDTRPGALKQKPRRSDPSVAFLCHELTSKRYVEKEKRDNVQIKTSQARIGGAITTERDAALPPFFVFFGATSAPRAESILAARALLCYSRARPQCDRLDATLRACDTDERNFQGMLSAAASSEKKPNTDPINKSLPTQTLFFRF